MEKLADTGVDAVRQGRETLPERPSAMAIFSNVCGSGKRTFSDSRRLTTLAEIRARRASQLCEIPSLFRASRTARAT
jgi:hypothetical protein